MTMGWVSADRKKDADVQGILDRKHERWIKNIVEGQVQWESRGSAESEWSWLQEYRGSGRGCLLFLWAVKVGRYNYGE